MSGTLGQLPQREGVSQLVEFNPERHEYRREGMIVPHVTAVIAAAGRCDWSFVDEELRLHSLKRGQSVHWMTQVHDEGALNYRSVPEGLRGYRRAWMAWRRETGFVPVWIERRFYSRYGFCGTLDRVGCFPATGNFGCRTGAVVDIKTGPIQDYTKYQLAAYSLAVDERFHIARNVRRVAVRLTSDGQYRTREWPSQTWDRDVAVFLADLKEMRRYESGAARER
jgi:hypothetical protein